MLNRYDVWQIDTNLIDNIWYLDSNLMDGNDGSGDATDYLYCENTLHPRALKLFTFTINDYKFLYEDKFNFEFNLDPVEKIINLVKC